MGLKNIEMQIALPRTFEAGKIQEQMQQRGQIQHDLMQEMVKKEEQLKQTGVVRQEMTPKANLRDKERGRDKQQYIAKKKKEEKVNLARHPYKGTKVDFSG